MNTKDLPQRLSKFLLDTRNLMTMDSDQRRQQEAVLEKEYRQLQRQFSRLRPADVSRLAKQASDESTQALIQHLILGREQVRKTQAPLARLIEEDPGRTDWAVSEFMTTLDAYRLIQSGRTKAKKEAELDEHANRLLAGMLGMEGIVLTGEFAKKVRGELLCGAIAYAHSHLCKKDVRAWHEEKSVRGQYNNDLEAYLCDCITRANVPLVYKARKRDDGVREIACVYLEGEDRDTIGKETEHNIDGFGAVAVKLQADAFCVNHDEKTFVVGGATTNNSFDAKQMESMVRHVLALEGLAANDPRFQGYKVRPFFFHSGYFCASPEGAEGQGKVFVEEMRENGMLQDHIEALSRMAFFNLLAERNPSPEAGRVFLLLNPHVAGCNTLEQYKASEAARSARMGSRGPALEVLKSLAKAAEALSSDVFDVTKSGPRETLLMGLHSAASNFYGCFPLPDGQAPSAEELRIMEKMSKSFDLIRDKLEDADSLGNLDVLYDDLARKYFKPVEMRRMLGVKARSSKKKGLYAWSEELFLELKDRWPGFSVNREKFLSHPMGQADSFMREMFDSTSKWSVLFQSALEKLQHDADPHGAGDPTARLLNQAEECLQDLQERTAEGEEGLSPNDYFGGFDENNRNIFKDNRSFTQIFRKEAGELEKIGGGGYYKLYTSTLRLACAFFSMDASPGGTSSKSGHLIFNRYAPEFIRACLNSQDKELASAAAAVMSHEKLEPGRKKGMHSGR